MSATTTSETREFTVLMTFRFPAWNEREGIRFTVRATSKREAVRRARGEAYNAGHTVGHSATELTFRTIEAETERA